MTDSLVELLVETVHAIGARAERRVEQQVINEIRKVSGKNNLLFEIANASLAQPDGTVREVGEGRTRPRVVMSLRERF